MRLAARMSRLGTETAFDVLAKVKALEKEGLDIISFAIGEPDFNTPDSIKEAAIAAIKANETHYNPSAGILPLREAVAAYMERTRHFTVDPDEVVITPGAKPILFYSILALVEAGDEVLYPNPGFPIYESVINFVGGTAVPLPLWEERGFRFDIDELRERVSDKTKLLILNSPQNPTGGTLNPDDLAAVAELAQRHDFFVLSDEVYSQLVYDGEFSSISQIPGMKERTIIVDGHSKTYAMTGWRLGFGVMPKELAAHIARLETNCESCTATFTQHAGAAALNGPQDEVRAMAREFEQRRDQIVALLNDIPGVSCHCPGGAFYVFPNVTQACKSLGMADSSALADFLLHQAHVAVLGRTCFGSRNEGETEEYIRLSYAASTETIAAGVERMKQAIISGGR